MQQVVSNSFIYNCTHKINTPYTHIKNLYFITDYIKIHLSDLREIYNTSIKYIQYILHTHHINPRQKRLIIQRNESQMT